MRTELFKTPNFTCSAMAISCSNATGHSKPTIFNTVMPLLILVLIQQDSAFTIYQFHVQWLTVLLCHYVNNKIM